MPSSPCTEQTAADHRKRLSELLPEQLSANAETIALVRQAMAGRDTARSLGRDIAFLAGLNEIFAPLHASEVRKTIPVISEEALQARAGQNLDLIERLTQSPIEGRRYLDIGCGRGYNLSEAHSRKALHCTGIDVFPGCQKIWNGRSGDTDQMQFILGDLHSHDFQGRTFDLISSFNSFEHFEDPALVLDRCRTILAPHGTLFLKFNPIFRSPMGSHQYRTINIPYVQNIFDDDIVAELFFNGKTRDPYPGLNRKRTREFAELLHGTGQWEPVFCKQVTDYRFAWMATVFDAEFQSCTDQDLYVSGIIAVLKPR